MSEPVEPRRGPARRASRSDLAFPGIWAIAVLVAVVSLALLFVGYRVFRIESERRAVIEARKLLDGQEAAIAAAREQQLKLSALRNEVVLQSKSVEGLKRTAAELEQKKQQMEGQLKADKEGLDRTRAEREHESLRAAELRADITQLVTELEHSHSVAAEANSAANSAKSALASLDAEIKNLTDRRDALTADVSRIEGKRLGLEEGARSLQADRSKIEEVGGDLQKLYAALSSQGASVKSSSDDLGAAATRVTQLSEVLENAAKSIDQEVKSLQTSTRTISGSEAPIRDASRELGETVRELKSSLENSQQEIARTAEVLGQFASRAAKANAKSEEQLVSAETVLSTAATRVERASGELESAASETSRSMEISGRDLGSVVTQLRASSKTLQQTLDDVERLRVQLRAVENVSAAKPKDAQ